MTMTSIPPWDLDAPPTVDEFARAVRFGFGRALLWLQCHDPTPYRDVILRAALTDHRYDSSESHRTEYTRELIRLARMENEIRGPLCEAVKQSRDDMDANHVVDLAGLLAKEGDIDLQRALYVALRANPWRYWLIDAVLRVDEITGLLNIADIMGDRDSPENSYPGDEQAMVVDLAQRTHSPASVWAALNRASRSRRRIAAFNGRVREYERESTSRSTRRNRPLTDDEAERLLGLPPRLRGARRCSFHPALHRWARSASDEALVRIAHALVQLPNNDCRLRDYLRIFRVRTFPFEPDRLIELVLQANLDVPIRDQFEDRQARIGFAALQALRKVRHPGVRELAFRLIGESQWQQAAYDLLVENFEPGDLAMLIERFEREPDEEHRHSNADTISEICERFRPADEVVILAMLYEHSRCAQCRWRFVRLLKEIDLLPSWIAQEYPVDAYSLVAD